MAKKNVELPTVEMEVTDIFGSDSRKAIREVEVLTVNFNSGGMRIRYVPSDYFGKTDEKYTVDVSNKPFMDKYKLQQR